MTTNLGHSSDKLNKDRTMILVQACVVLTFSQSACDQRYTYSHGRAWCAQHTQSKPAAEHVDNEAMKQMSYEINTTLRNYLPPSALVAAFTNVKDAAAKVYDLKVTANSHTNNLSHLAR